MVSVPEPSAGDRPEPWGPRLWLAVAVAVAATTLICSYGIATWPMADDEIPTLVEMGLVELSADAFSVPATQIGRLPKAMPVWYSVQKAALALLPQAEWAYRLPSLACAVATVALAFVAAARWRGLWFAAALAIVVLFSQMFVLLAQVHRFYSMPLLLLIGTLLCAASRGPRLLILAATGLLAALTVLSHNITVAVFGLAFLAAAGAWLLRGTPSTFVVRTGTAAVVGAVLYFAYIRPLIAGWSSTGNPTPVLVSFTAHAGVPIVALALFAIWLCVSRHDRPAPVVWCALLFLGTLTFFVVAPVTWNPRYFVFFMPAMWVLAAFAVYTIGSGMSGFVTRAAWYACVMAILLPSLASHYRDGSRHDYRTAAAVITANVRAGEAILSDDAETISYYLPQALHTDLRVRTKVTTFPERSFLLVTRSNAWLPLPAVPARRMDVLAEIAKRRYDQFSHILRVYRVEAVKPDSSDMTSIHD